MKERIKSNSGFTLIELIIAIAILAFLMTAISAFMTSSVATTKKAKADIVVGTSAQETYDQLSDSIKSAKDIILCVYAENPDLDFSVSDEDTSAFGSTDVIYYVRDKAQEDVLKAMPEYDSSNSTIEYYSDISDTSKVMYVKQIIVDTSVELEYDKLDPSTNYLTGYNKSKLTGEAVEIRKMTKEVNYTPKLNDDGTIATDADGNIIYVATTYSGDEVTSSTGKEVYNIKDTCRKIFTFDANNMYLERKYAFMDYDDYYGKDGPSDSWDNYLYTESLGYLNIDSANTVTGCTASVDADNGTIDINLYFNDKNMTYTTLGKINIQNSYVLKAKK